MPTTDIVQISIVAETASASQAGFGTPLILSCNADWVERVRFYADLTEVAEDFDTDMPEYLAAQAMFSQNPRPEQVAIGRLANKPTQAFKISVASVVNATDYEVRVGEETASYTSDSSADNDEIAGGLATDLETLTAASGFVATTAGSAGSEYVTLTAGTAGDWFDVAVQGPNGEGDPSLLLIEQNHADPGVAADLTAILNETDAWYAICNPWNSKAMALAIAAWAEANGKIYVAASNDSVIITTAAGGTDLADDMSGLGYDNSAVFYHPTMSEFADAALLGRCLPLTPGSETWANKQLTGVTAAVLTSTHRTNLDAKNANYFYEIAGLSITRNGKMAGGDFIDVTRFLHWYKARLSERIISRMVQLDKIAYTDAGVAVLESEVRAQNLDGIAAGGIAEDPAPTVTVPRVADAADADKAARILRNIRFSFTLAGAIHKTVVQGTVSV